MPPEKQHVSYLDFGSKASRKVGEAQKKTWERRERKTGGNKREIRMRQRPKPKPTPEPNS